LSGWSVFQIGLE